MPLYSLIFPDRRLLRFYEQVLNCGKNGWTNVRAICVVRNETSGLSTFGSTLALEPRLYVICSRRPIVGFLSMIDHGFSRLMPSISGDAKSEPSTRLSMSRIKCNTISSTRSPTRKGVEPLEEELGALNLKESQ